jgi:hypothetical protein
MTNRSIAAGLAGDASQGAALGGLSTAPGTSAVVASPDSAAVMARGVTVVAVPVSDSLRLVANSTRPSVVVTSDTTLPAAYAAIGTSPQGTGGGHFGAAAASPELAATGTAVVDTGSRDTPEQAEAQGMEWMFLSGNDNTASKASGSARLNLGAAPVGLPESLCDACFSEHERASPIGGRGAAVLLSADGATSREASAALAALAAMLGGGYGSAAARRQECDLRVPRPD